MAEVVGSPGGVSLSAHSGDISRVVSGVANGYLGSERDVRHP